MKKVIILFLSVLLFSCEQQQSEACKALETANQNLERDLAMYATTWEDFFSKRDINVISDLNFDAEATLVTATGNITGIEGFRDYYNNYLTGFSDAQFIALDIFGQGDKIVKHWNFKGTHDGNLFGIPATNNKVDLYGTTIVTLKNGKVLKEENFFDNQIFFKQLGLTP